MHVVTSLDRNTSATAFTTPTSAVVAFRGTEAFGRKPLPDILAQWVSNAQYTQVAFHQAPVGGKVCKTHAGFTEAVLNVGDELGPGLEHDVRQGKQLWLAGPSRGGALALAAGALCHARGCPVRGVYTFGAPRFGEPWFADHYPWPAYRVVNRGDIVPEGLLPVMPNPDGEDYRYKHVGTYV